MKKGCLIVLVVLGVLLGAALISGLVGYRIANERFGIGLAPVISHDMFATPETRIRLSIRPELLTPYFVDFVPQDINVPTRGFEIEEILHHIVPREVAILARTDMMARRLRLTLFINEKRGGPFIEKAMRDQDPFSRVQQISWTSDGLELHGRGALIAEGYLPIPGEVEAELLQIWPTRSQQPPATVLGTNQVELVIDNSNGDILALAATMAAAGGESWEDLRKDQMANTAVDIIKGILVARLSANMIDKDSAEFELNLTADPGSGLTLQFLLTGLAVPWLTDTLRDDYDLTLTGDMQWNEAQSAIVGRYTVIGLAAFFKEQTQG